MSAMDPHEKLVLDHIKVGGNAGSLPAICFTLQHTEHVSLQVYGCAN